MYWAKPRRSKAFPFAGLIVMALVLISAALGQSRVRGWVSPPRHRVVAAKAAIPAQVLNAPLPINRPLSSPPFPVPERSGILWNMSTHQILWGKNPNDPLPMASTTKLMTFYLAAKHLSLNQPVSISPTAAGTGGSDIRMAPGNQFSVDQLLYGLMLASANDSAVALAETVSGSTANFVKTMNQTAQSLGMLHTHYADPSGLSKLSTGTAWDLSILAEQDMQNPLFRQIVRTKQTALPQNPVVINLNGLLFRDPSVIGIKTGWTTEAGFNLVYAATRTVDGRPVTLLGVLMHGDHGFPPVYADAESLLNWGFQAVANQSLQQVQP